MTANQHIYVRTRAQAMNLGVMETMAKMKELVVEQAAEAKRQAAEAQGGGFESSAALNAALMDPEFSAEDMEMGTPMVMHASKL